MSLRLFIPAIQGKYHRQISLRLKVSVVKIPHSTIFLCTYLWKIQWDYCMYNKCMGLKFLVLFIRRGKLAIIIKKMDSVDKLPTSSIVNVSVTDSTILFDELQWPCATMCYYNNIDQRWPVLVVTKKTVVPKKNSRAKKKRSCRKKK